MKFTRAQGSFGRSGFASFRKYKPHQCPKCKFYRRIPRTLYRFTDEELEEAGMLRDFKEECHQKITPYQGATILSRNSKRKTNCRYFKQGKVEYLE